MARRRRSAKKVAAPPDTGETRAADFMTVGWMVAILTALVCEAASIGAWWYYRLQPDAIGMSRLSGMLLFAALVAGCAGLVLTVIVWNARRVPPPYPIVVTAVVVCLVPLALMYFR